MFRTCMNKTLLMEGVKSFKNALRNIFDFSLGGLLGAGDMKTVIIKMLESDSRRISWLDDFVNQRSNTS